MATYYMRADGSAANRFEAPGPTTDPTKCMCMSNYDLQGYDVGDIIIISQLGGTTWDTYFRTRAPGVIYRAAPGEGKITFDGVGLISHTLQITHNNCSFTNFIVKSAPTYFGVCGLGANGAILNNIEAIDCGYSISFDTMTGFIITNFKAVGMTNTSGSSGYFTDSVGTFNGLLVKASAANPMKRWWFYGSVGCNINLNQALFTGCETEALTIYAGSAVAIANSILAGNQKSSLNDTIVNAGTCTLDHSLWLPPWRKSTQTLPGVTITNDVNPAVVMPLPGWRSYAHQGILTLGVDDADLDFAEQYLTLLATFGFYGTFNIYQTGIVKRSNYQARLQAIVAAGHDIGDHSYSHWTLDTLNAFSIAKTGETLTIAINRVNPNNSSTWTGTLITSGGQNINLAAAPNNTIGGLIATLTAAGYTCVVNSLIGNGGADGNSLVLGNVTAHSINTAYNVAANQTALFQVEIIETKAWIEALIGNGYICRTFSLPGGNNSATVIAAIQAAGFLGAQGDIGVQDITSYHLNAFAIYHLYSGILSDLMADKTQASIWRRVASWCVSIQENNLIGENITHNSNDFTIPQVALMFEVIKASGVPVMKVGDAFALIRNSTLWATADGGQTWTRTFATDQSDYHLLAQSPCGVGGMNVGLNADYDGVPLPHNGGYPIGPYTYIGEVGI